MKERHAEFRYKSEGSDTVVVFIHGIQGSPLQFDYLIQRLNGTYSIENLLLPGHGKTAKDFGKSSMAQWQSYVDERVVNLQNDYKNIILVGHSLGGLLSIQTSLSHPQQIQGLFLMALPLKLHFRYSYIKNNLAIAFSKSNSNEIIAAARNGNSVSASNPFEYLACTPRYIELLKKIKSTRILLPQLQLPVVIVQSANDEIVSHKSLRYTANMQHFELITAESSGHYYYSKADNDIICTALERFIAPQNISCV